MKNTAVVLFNFIMIVNLYGGNTPTKSQIENQAINDSEPSWWGQIAKSNINELDKKIFDKYNLKEYIRNSEQRTILFEYDQNNDPQDIINVLHKLSCVEAAEFYEDFGLRYALKLVKVTFKPESYNQLLAFEVLK